jgi:hypothetical protein
MNTGGIMVARKGKVVAGGEPIGVELAEAVEWAFLDHGKPLRRAMWRLRAKTKTPAIGQSRYAFA